MSVVSRMISRLRPSWVPPDAAAALQHQHGLRFRRVTQTIGRTSVTGTATDTSGNVSRYAAAEARRTNRGLRVEKARQSGVLNPNGVGFLGSVTGDDWLIAAATGITIALSARTEISDDLYAVDFDVSGTSATDLQNLIFFNGTGTFAATNSDKVIGIGGLALLSGTDTGVKSFKLMAREQTGATVKATDTPTSSLGIDATLRDYEYLYFPTHADTTTLRYGLRFVSAAGVAVSFTLRIYLVDLAKNLQAIPSRIVNPTDPDPNLNLNTDPNLALATGVGLSSTDALTMDTGDVATLTADDGTQVTGRYFHFYTDGGNPATAASQFIRLNDKTVNPIAAVVNDVITETLYIGAINPGGGDAGNISDMSTKVLLARQYNSSDVLQANASSTSVTIDTALRRVSNRMTIADADTTKVEVGFQLSPSGSLAFDFWLFIGKVFVAKNATNSAAADTVTLDTPALTGTKGALLVKFRPGAYLDAYKPITFAQASDATNKLEFLIQNTTEIRARITRAGVADTDIEVDTGSLTAEMESAVCLSWDLDAGTVKVCLNGLPVVSTETDMPFSDLGTATVGPVEGTITEFVPFRKPLSDARMRALTRSKVVLVPCWFGGQSLDAGADGQRSTTAGDTGFIGPAEYQCIQPGFPREFMFRFERRALTIGGHTRDDVRGGGDRLGDDSDDGDQAWTTPQGIRRSKAQQFVTSAHFFTPGEATIRALANRFPAHWVFLNMTVAIGGAGLSDQQKVATATNGHTSYDDGIVGITAAKEVARLQGWTIPHVVISQAMSYTDGASLTRSQIVDEFEDFKADTTSDIAALLPDTQIHYFTNIGPSFADDNIAAAEAALDLIDAGDWTVTGDYYWTSSYGGTQRLNDDGIHGSTVLYQLMGEEAGQVIADVLRGGTHTPWQPVSVTRSGDNYDIDFGEAIEANTTDIVSRTSKGIEIFATVGGGALTIDSATILPDGQTLRVTVANGTGVGATVKGGMQGYTDAGPDYDIADRRGINLCSPTTLGTYTNGLTRKRFPVAFEAVVA